MEGTVFRSLLCDFWFYKDTKRKDLTSTQVVSKLRTNEELGETVGESRETIRRYIRLTELIRPLLDLVDAEKLKFIPAVELADRFSRSKHCFCRFSCVDNRNADPKTLNKMIPARPKDFLAKFPRIC